MSEAAPPPRALRSAELPIREFRSLSFSHQTSPRGSAFLSHVRVRSPGPRAIPADVCSIPVSPRVWASPARSPVRTSIVPAAAPSPVRRSRAFTPVARSLTPQSGRVTAVQGPSRHLSPPRRNAQVKSATPSRAGNTAASATIGSSLPAAALPPPPTSQPPQDIRGVHLASLLGVLPTLFCSQVVQHLSEDVLAAFALLADQAVRMGIDYKTLSLGWSHPRTRTQYRGGKHASSTCSVSRARAEESRRRLLQSVLEVAANAVDGQEAVVEAFKTEIGIPYATAIARDAAFDGVVAALKAELLLPLRALMEGQGAMRTTFSGEPVPLDRVAVVVQAIVDAVLSRPMGYADWRYSNPVGIEQLRGLSPAQLQLWRDPTLLEHGHGIRTHEDGPTELGFFWATKIGGPSHGFDYEGQCLLPLLSNARSKVILVSHPSWPAHPPGRAYFRLLWASESSSSTSSSSHAEEARLWLEDAHVDFDAAALTDRKVLAKAVLQHAVAKADCMEVALSVETSLLPELHALIMSRSASASAGQVELVTERLILRPSNGVCEASDSLSHRHDWVQLTTEMTQPLPRALYRPSAVLC